jgi:ABC-2 type transport system ATP-binding protein
MSEPDVVTVRGLRKSYGGRVVVDDVDLDVRPAEIVGLIGANGAGKTTTVECVQGLRRPDAGRLRVLGADPVTQPARVRAMIGSQLQSSGLPDRLRVGEAVRLFGGRDDDDRLEQFGLAGRRRSAFASLSGGERQRLFLVLALVGSPRLVILDELTQGLDPAARRSVWAAVDQLRADGTSVLLVTHELDEAERLCDRVVAMRAGRVLDSGSPGELASRYGQNVTITFTQPAGVTGLAPGELRALPGVTGVSRQASRVVITGVPAAIAYVGAALASSGHVSADLSVRMPTLEDALLGLLDRDQEMEQDEVFAMEGALR